MNKTENILSKEELIEILNRKIEDVQYTLKKARSPKNKRGYTWAVNIYKSLKYYVEKSKEDENKK